MITNQPLAARMRPRELGDIIGQDHLMYPGSPLQQLTQNDAAISVLLYGPPGTGKTSIANVIAQQTAKNFIELSATSAGVADVRKTLATAEKNREAGQQTLVFIDEIHRFSKTQQDVLLPAVEAGTISLIGATTENPSFSVNSALSSRSTILVLRPISSDDIVKLLERALLEDPEIQSIGIAWESEALRTIAELSTGDVRQALGRLETAIATANAMFTSNPTTTATQPIITHEVIEQISGTALQRYDRDGDQHYDVVSAFIKSMRGSDPDAALHWLARMIEGGEDPRFIARRLVVHASEDVGMADPTVLGVCVAAAQAVQLVGLPEARLNLAQATVAIATAAKSNAVYNGINQAIADVQAGRTGNVPMHLRDSHYPGARALGHGQGYRYPHDYPGHLVEQQYLPDAMKEVHYYQPTTNGHENTIGAVQQAIQEHYRAAGRST